MNPTISKQVTHSLRNNSSESLMAVERERERESSTLQTLFYSYTKNGKTHGVTFVRGSPKKPSPT